MHVALYETIHSALIEILAEYGIKASLCQGKDREVNCPEDTQKGTVPFSLTRKSGQSPEPFLCFLRRAPGDVLLGNTKIAGSAQRRSRGAVLQHGSVLLGRSLMAPELDGLAEAAAVRPDGDQLASAWSARLAETFSLRWQPGVLTDSEGHRSQEFAREKYDSLLWTQHRGRGKEIQDDGEKLFSPPQ
jgi:lipoate-protein ligase A